MLVIPMPSHPPSLEVIVERHVVGGVQYVVSGPRLVSVRLVVVVEVVNVILVCVLLSIVVT